MTSHAPGASQESTDSSSVAPLVEVRDLQVTFRTATGVVNAVKGADLTIYPGQTVAIVGESGSGKSTTAHALIGLLPGTGKVTGGSITFDGREIAHLRERDLVAVRGREIGLVPQDPMSNLNPVWRIGTQIKEALRANGVDVTRRQRLALTEALAQADEGDLGELSALVVDADSYVGRKGKAQLLALVTEVLGAAAAQEFDPQLVVGTTTHAVAGEALTGIGVPAERVRATLDALAKADAKDRVAGLLAESGLPDALARAQQYPHEFSGGMRQRALIAMGLAARPKLLIADEPTSALDVTVQRQILDHLSVLTSELGTAVLFITHDLGLAAERAEHLVVMYRGKVVESGPARAILAAPKHPYTQRLVASAPSLASRRIESAKARGEEAADLLAATGGDGVSEARDDVVVASDLVKVFVTPGKKLREKVHFTAVDHVSFTLKRGTTLAIVGESGSGKSTVANMVLDLLPPTAGTIAFDGKDLAALTRSARLEFRRRVQPVFQNPYGSLDPMMSIFRAIEEPLRIHGVGDQSSRTQRVKDLLEMVSMPASTMRRFPNELSGGQRQRIAIARALALDPEVIVCDEAVSALDVLVQAQILTLLNDLQAEMGLSYLFITHDLAVVRQIADEVLVMEAGKVVEHATTDEVFERPQQEYTRELLAAIPGRNLEGSQIAG
jgi:peptide/nickel transport system ATP-binding protein